MTSRVFLLMAVGLALAQDASTPWPQSSVLEPAELARTLRSSASKPAVICAGPAVLYRAKHIAGAIAAGPGSTPEGIATLKKAVAGMPKDADIVLYCGCCPMKVCPNIRPAFQALKEMGFTRIRVLDLPTNTATDWYSKGYPSEAGPSAR